MPTESGVSKGDLGSRVCLTGMLTDDLEHKRCQGRAAPAGLGLDNAGAEDRLCRASKVKGDSNNLPKSVHESVDRSP